MRIRKVRKGIGSDAGNINVTGTLPVGSIISYGGFNAPEGWMICDGLAISRTNYSKLFEAIGTTYGSGDGSTTFNLPDLRDKFILGAGVNHNIAETGGEETHQLVIDEIPSMDVHMTQHTWFDRGGLEAGGAVNRKVVAGGGTGGSPEFVIGTVNGGGQAHNNMPPYNTTLFIIKVREVSIVASTAQVINSLESNSTTDALSANQGKILNEKINGTVLYNNSSGTSANITFTNNITTYKRLMIEYFNESEKNICVSNIPVVLNRLFTLMDFHEGTDNNYLFVAKIKLESNKLVWNSNLRYFLNSGMSETNRKMFISKITGYTY